MEFTARIFDECMTLEVLSKQLLLQSIYRTDSAALFPHFFWEVKTINLLEKTVLRFILYRTVWQTAERETGPFMPGGLPGITAHIRRYVMSQSLESATISPNS